MIHMGTFDSEFYWRDSGLSRLPSIPDQRAHNIITAMDELLFPFCNTDDCLITLFKFDSGLKDYLSSLGLSFQHNKKDCLDFGLDDEISVFSFLMQDDPKKHFSEFLNEDTEISPYAVLPETVDMCELYRIPYRCPDIESVRKVNSKFFSNQLNHHLGTRNKGIVVLSHTELLNKGKELLKSSGFIIKDVFGVSGGGNILIRTEGMLKRISKYLSVQEEKGLKTLFVIEPCLDKCHDFSCQMSIDKSGNYEILSIQRMINSDFMYMGSYTADEAFIENIEKQDYFRYMDEVARAVYAEGYYGELCIDSMVLTNGVIVPIVEINARKSMGLINHRLDRFLSTFSLKGKLLFFNVGYSESLSFDLILSGMEQAGILFTPERESGILPLSANTLLIDSRLDKTNNTQEVKKGRFYLSAVEKDNGRMTKLVESLREFLLSLSFTLYN